MNNTTISYLILKQSLGRMASAILWGEGGRVRGCTSLESEKRGPFNRSDVATDKGREDGWKQERVKGGEAGRDEGGGGEEEERERAVTWRLRTRTNPAWFSTPAA